MVYSDLVPNDRYNSRRAIWHFIDPGLQDNTVNLPPGFVPYSALEKAQARKLIAKLLSNLTMKYQETTWLFGGGRKFRDEGSGLGVSSSTSVDSRYGGDATQHQHSGRVRSHGTLS